MKTAEKLVQQGLPDGRLAGVSLHLSSLPGRYGIGSIGDSARGFIDRLTQMRLSVWQFLPTGPTAYADSPYQCLSSFAGNEMLIDVAGLIRLGLICPAEADSLIDLPDDFVDYGRLIPKKEAVLALAASRFDARAGDELKHAYQLFVAQHDSLWLHDYALFRVLKSRHAQRPWQEWQDKYRTREPQALQDIEQRFASELGAVKVIQFLFDVQWSKLRSHAASNNVYLFGDMPIYIALDSADAWACPQMLRLDSAGAPTHVAGVPPDYFSAEGQLWGNPLYDWDYHAATGYAWWVERMRAAARMVDMVRIDHFRGFEAFWEVPAGADTARKGRWVSGPGDELFHAVRAALGSLPVVAEDLGLITPEVVNLRDRHQIPGMLVLQFALADERFSLADIDSNCICYTGTHDNDTTVGWFKGSPDDNRCAEEILRTEQLVLERTGGAAETIARDVIRLAFSSPARISIAPMQDFLGLGSQTRMNRPGTASNNWRWRLLPTQISPALCDWVSQMVRQTGREPAHLANHLPR